VCVCVCVCVCVSSTDWSCSAAMALAARWGSELGSVFSLFSGESHGNLPPCSSPQRWVRLRGVCGSDISTLDPRSERKGWVQLPCNPPRSSPHLHAIRARPGLSLSCSWSSTASLRTWSWSCLTLIFMIIDHYHYGRTRFLRGTDDDAGPGDRDASPGGRAREAGGAGAGALRGWVSSYRYIHATTRAWAGPLWICAYMWRTRASWHACRSFPYVLCLWHIWSVICLGYDDDDSDCNDHSIPIKSMQDSGLIKTWV